MALTDKGLASLVGEDSVRAAPFIPKPPRRWKTRILIPGAIVACAVAILAYSAKSTFLPATEVWVVPVVTLAGGQPSSDGQSEPATMLVQAPGWIEPDPYPVSVPALAEGVIREVLVLEGSRVEAGQVVARLIDDDARLAVEAAEAQLASLEYEVLKANADIGAADARVTEIEDPLERLRSLTKQGGVSQIELSQMEIRLKAAHQNAASARAALGVAEAQVRRQQVACREAELTLKRMEVVAPVAGTVMVRLVEPGSRISMSAGGNRGTESMNGTILRLYDPARLQVRVDVPLADYAKIGIGTAAEVVTEALPATIFRGEVTRVVHEANIQRNTVQVKVAIRDPVETLKPEMLARVRFIGKSVAPSNAVVGGSPSSGGAGLRLMIPAQVLLDRSGDTARVWVVENDPNDHTTVASERKIRTESTISAGSVAVVEGLRPGDRVIVDPPTSLRQGTRVSVLGEAPDEPSAGKGESP